MGEAKRRTSAMRKMLIAEAKGWCFPPSEEEAKTLLEIQKICPITVYRISQDQLDYMRMKPKECHTNCMFYVENDPFKAYEHVIGWINAGGAFILHSVLKRAHEYSCITPMPYHITPDVFDFYPDEHIRMEANEHTGVFEFWRGEYCLPKGVREDPVAAIAQFSKMKDDLESGVDIDLILSRLNKT